MPLLAEERDKVLESWVVCDHHYPIEPIGHRANLLQDRSRGSHVEFRAKFQFEGMGRLVELCGYVRACVRVTESYM